VPGAFAVVEPSSSAPVCGADCATAAKKARSFSGSLRPGADSVPLAVSTASGAVCSIACATLSARSPPLRISGTFERRP
jgi:hypothetical protein